METLDWKSLPFGYIKTDYNVRCYYRNGKWGELEISSSEYINLHMAATALHYGQEAFEGMKAFMGKDGGIRLFRWDENSLRMKKSAEGIMLAEVPDSLFHDAIVKCVKMNKHFVPPYGTWASLYSLDQAPRWVSRLLMNICSWFLSPRLGLILKSSLSRFT